MGFDERHVLPSLRLMPYDRLVVVAGPETFRSAAFRRLKGLEPGLRTIRVDPFDLTANRAQRHSFPCCQRLGGTRQGWRHGARPTVTEVRLVPRPAPGGSQNGLRGRSPCRTRARRMVQVRVEIRLKKGVTDPEGD